MKILVLGGNGFIGSAIVRALSVKGMDVTVATRKKSLNQVVLRMQTMLDSAAWIDVIEPFDIVINAVGILRPRLFESYDDVHPTRQLPWLRLFAKVVNDLSISLLWIYSQRLKVVLS